MYTDLWDFRFYNYFELELWEIYRIIQKLYFM